MGRSRQWPHSRLGVWIACFLACSLFVGIFGHIDDRDAQSAGLSKEALMLRKEREAKEEELSASTKRALCPGGCNQHGTCKADGTCQCNANWAGDDCSYEVLVLTSGVPLRNRVVNAQKWHYYNITTTGSGLLVVVNQTSSSGDSDMYILKGDFPSRTKYTQRDITTDRNFAIQIDSADAGFWFVGIFGFMTTTYTITATTNSQCADLNNCNSPNGQCVGPHTCQCESGWTGDDCSERSSLMTPGTTYSGSVAWNQWVFYTATITTGNTFVVIFNQTSRGDLDLYVRYEQQPSLWNWDFRDTTGNTNIDLRVDNPQRGTWYIGVYGYTAGTFNIKLVDSVKCPNDCSRHGTCRGTTCYCSAGFRGSACELMINDLSDSVPVSGYVSDNSWNYYHMKANTQNNLVINVQQQANAAGQDCDLFAKSGSNPTRFDFNYRSIGFQSNFNLTIPDPSDEVWYFGVFGYSNCSYTITAFITTRCPGNPTCSNRGLCVNGFCVCDTGFSGANCSLALTPLSNGGKPASGIVNTRNPWTFYTINIVSTTYLAIELKETNTKGFVWLYASKGGQPDTRNYDESDKETNSKFHRIHIEFDTPTTEQWIIGVYANPFANGDVGYQLSVWYPPF